MPVTISSHASTIDELLVAMAINTKYMLFIFELRVVCSNFATQIRRDNDFSRRIKSGVQHKTIVPRRVLSSMTATA